MKNIFVQMMGITFALAGCQSNDKKIDPEKEKQEVTAVLNQYKSAVEMLDTTGTAKLFHADSRVFESGSYEGNYRKYETEHLGPEFSEFLTFKYFNYAATVDIDMPYAFTSETYKYEILVKEDSTIALRDGVATSVLKKENDEWKILISHNSSYKQQSGHK